MTASKFSSAASIKYGWAETKKNFWFFAGILALACITYVVYDSSLNPNLNNIITAFVSGLLNVILGMGIIHISLKIYDRRKVSYEDIVDPAPLFFRYIGASLLYIMIVICGLILFIVPGVILAIKYGFYPFVMIDRKLSIKNSLKKSAEITEGSKLELLALGILLGLINFVGLIPLGLGLFVTVPIGWMATVYAYRRLS
jgi:uncharacterized membrane protein